MAVVNFPLFCFIPINLVAFYKKNNQEKQDILTAIELFSKDSGKSGRSGKSGKYNFRKKIFFENVKESRGGGALDL